MQPANRDTRGVLRKPEWGRLRQGVIFCGARADNYEGSNVYGLVITANCDLAHDKVAVINYIPVVPIEDWMHRDFAEILLRRIAAQQVGRLKSLLKAAGFSASILETESTKKVVGEFLNDTSNKAARTRHEQAQAASDALKLCADLQSHCVVGAEDLKKLKDTDPASFARAVEECIGNKLNGYHFLSGVEFGGNQSGYVVLLRQIYHLPFPIAQAIAGGTDTDGLAGARGESPLLYIDTRQGTFAMPIGQVEPPFLEHLMQAFALLYSRIGVQDISDSYLKTLTASLGDRT